MIEAIIHCERRIEYCLLKVDYIFGIHNRDYKMPVEITSDKLLTYDDLVNPAVKKEICLVDVREPDEIKTAGELPGSINIPLSELKKALEELPESEFETKYKTKKPGFDASLVFSCYAGGRSLKALQLALELGYSKAKHYKGGFSDWKNHAAPEN